MKGILGLLRHKNKPDDGQDKLDSRLYTTVFPDSESEDSLLVPWRARAVEVGARNLEASRGIQLLQALWSKDRHMRQLDAQAITQLAPFFEFASVAANRDIIRQDEYGDFMIVLLSGDIAIERTQPWGTRLRLAEAAPGEILGEMSLLDSGVRFSLCTTVSDCEIAILDAESLQEMLCADPRAAANLIALLARKLSLRLRVVSARLSDK
jgi:CRP/FNR family transcriptional regulator, cyclic AMP receptor protein